MKKAYVKPAIYIENFTLAQSVAAGGCGAAVGYPMSSDKYSCGWSLGNDVLWNQDGICMTIIGTDEDWLGVCYNNPGDGNSIFSAS